LSGEEIVGMDLNGDVVLKKWGGKINCIHKCINSWFPNDSRLYGMSQCVYCI
jgi:hypothetical protein